MPHRRGMLRDERGALPIEEYIYELSWPGDG